ncbi:MAG: hypothetical protein E3J29_04780 [Dehalococcoidia bacterium]|nr:MAG: hypothetical protein E3J29_04780 [Dehalococcoidia bacterium]
MLAQACDGGSTSEEVTRTATTPAGTEKPHADGGVGPGARGQALLLVGASEEFAAFLGIPLEELESELSPEGATPGNVAEEHGRTREEVKTFFMEQLQVDISDAVAAETMSQEDADHLIEKLTSRIDDIIDGTVPSDRPERGPEGQ